VFTCTGASPTGVTWRRTQW